MTKHNEFLPWAGVLCERLIGSENRFQYTWQGREYSLMLVPPPALRAPVERVRQRLHFDALAVLIDDDSMLEYYRREVSTRAISR